MTKIRIFGIAWVLVCGVVAAFLTAVLRRKLIDGCAPPAEVGMGEHGEGFLVLFFIMPITALGVWILMGGTYALITWRSTWISYTAPVVSLIPCILVMWAMTSWSYQEYYDVFCPTGYPTWWPSWIPL